MRHHFYTVSGVALALALTPAAGQAADLVQTLKDQGQFSQLVSAIEQAGLAGSLQGEGPYTVFAPTDEAFGKLPQGAVDQLAQSNGQLGNVLKHHVVEGKEVMAKDVLGQEMQVSTLSGDQITVDGTATVMVLVPAGLQIARVGDQVFVSREVGAMAAPAVTVTTSDQGQQQGAGAADQGQQQQQAAGSSSSSSPSGSGSSSDQQQAAGSSGSSSQQSNGSGGQQQAAADTQNPEAAAGQELTEEDRSAAAQQQQQQAAGGSGQGQPVEQQQGMLRAAMVVAPDIQADNGVIHAISEVLVPQKIEQQLGQAGQGQSSQQGSSN